MSGKGQVVVLTGASRGIGLAVAQYLLEQKCNVVIVARNKEDLEKIRNISEDQVQVVAGSLGDFSTAEEAVSTAKKTWGRIDSLIINHGILEPMKRICDANVDDWRASFDVNFFSALAIIKAAVPELRKTKGRVIFTSSGAAVGAYSAWGAYGASKAAINHLNMTLAAEEPDITSVSIRPGVVDTDMQRDLRETHHKVMDAKDNKKFADLKATEKLLRPSQPGNVIARLAIGATKDLSGKFLSWDHEKLAEF